MWQATKKEGRQLSEEADKMAGLINSGVQ